MTKLHEGNGVAVKISHMKVETAPGPSNESLGEFHTAILIFFEELSC